MGLINQDSLCRSAAFEGMLWMWRGGLTQGHDGGTPPFMSGASALNKDTVSKWNTRFVRGSHIKAQERRIYCWHSEEQVTLAEETSILTVTFGLEFTMTTWFLSGLSALGFCFPPRWVCLSPFCVFRRAYSDIAFRCFMNRDRKYWGFVAHRVSQSGGKLVERQSFRRPPRMWSLILP